MDKKRILATVVVFLILAFLFYLQYRHWRTFDWGTFWSQTHRIRKWHVLNLADLEVAGRQSGGERGGELTHVIDCIGIRVERKNLAALAEQMDEIASVAAAGIEHAHAGGDVSAQDLVEDVNINLSELFLNGQGHLGLRGIGLRAVWGELDG